MTVKGPRRLLMERPASPSAAIESTNREPVAGRVSLNFDRFNPQETRDGAE
jgi:hypothetical protein